ncbi:uncharacterized protein il12rb1 [Pseudoliparis swirei]|uniref:uncharacterized protein il12rb1 n=1 Tax=Pseudoliparis swirei TaxID=2059687 RepID=UPI0024BEBAF3|nr:uncharacterized protein il12rb1 [Pseudoliparis swirei]
MTCEEKRAGPSLETTCILKKEDIKVLQGAALVWVEARLGSTTCRSAKRTVVLRHTGHVVVPNLLQDSVYQVQVRHRSAGAKNPLWSPWSEVLTVPAVCGNSVPDPPHEKLQSRTCRQWHEIQDGGSSSPDPEITLTAKTLAKERKQRTKRLRDYVRYLYSEHRCVDGSKPQTLQMCLFYKRQGAPLREPQDLAASGETLTSADLSWSQIPPAAQRGFLTHLVLCSVRLGPQDHVKECRNISASLTSHRLEDLTPGTKYNISLVGVTGAGRGPEATVSINTLPEKTGNVWWILGLLSLFFLLTTMCTCILKRISNKIFHPVPKPVFPDFILNPPDSQQEFLEGKEELDELTLHQSVPKHPEELLLLTGEEDEGEEDRLDMSDEESHSSEDPKSSRGDETDLEQVDNEIAMLIYRNGLVFDLKTDES